MGAELLDPAVELPPPDDKGREVATVDSVEREIWMSKVAGTIVVSTLYSRKDIDVGTKPPVVVVNGFAAHKVTYDGTARELAQRGWPVAVFESPRTQRWSHAYSPAHFADALRVQGQSVVATVQGALDRTGAEKAVVVGHSLGNMTSIGAALHARDEVAAVVSDAGAGLDGPGAIVGKIGRLGRIYRNEIREEVGNMYEEGELLDFARKSLYHVFRSPGRQVRETVAAARWRRTEAGIEKLRAQGVLVAAVLPEDDEFFYPDEVLDRNGHQFDVHSVIPKARHVHINAHPKEHAVVLDEVISDLHDRMS